MSGNLESIIRIKILLYNKKYNNQIKTNKNIIKMRLNKNKDKIDYNQIKNIIFKI